MNHINNSRLLGAQYLKFNRWVLFYFNIINEYLTYSIILMVIAHRFLNNHDCEKNNNNLKRIFS